MRIGVDATSWFNGRGYGRYTRELLPRLVATSSEHRWLVYVESMNAQRLDVPGAEIRPVRCGEAPSAAASAAGARSPRDMLRFRKAVGQDRPEVFFCPTVYSFFPLPRGQRAVVGVHDAIAERFPERCFASTRARLFWNLKVWWALRQASLVLTVSEFAREELERHLSLGPDRVRVAVEAPSEVFRAPVTDEEVAAASSSVGLPAGARWFTYVGGFNPHKNVDVLLRAHAAMDDGAYLLLVGTRDEDVFHGCLADLDRLTEELGTGSRVIWTGFVEDGVLRGLHSGAVANVLPSACEGFGLPAVEAAACGAPVVATVESPLPRLLEGGGRFVEPGDPEALAEAMAGVDDPATREQARARALQLNWEDTASAVLRVLEEAAS